MDGRLGLTTLETKAAQLVVHDVHHHLEPFVSWTDDEDVVNVTERRSAE
jgi:hypothetical protein